uniref:GLOBIN domain-containing protein n=1 Tax=Panagrellus redivivus TaxID=6233 RepID=A0A7E4V4J3_PANRE
MGSHHSTPQLTLAEKRYRVGSPERIKKKVPKPTTKNGKKKSASSMALSTSGNGIASTLSTNRHDVTVTRSNSANVKELGVNGRNGSMIQRSTSNREVKTAVTSANSSLSSGSDAASLQSASVSILAVTPSNTGPLTRTQRLLVENSWKRSRKSGADNVGTKIFLLVLTAQPDIKMIFGLEKVPQGRLKYDPRFRRHAVVFNRTFDYIVKNLHYTEKLVQHFQALGKKHVLMQGRGFLPQYWDTFAECMTQTAIEWEGGQRCRDTMVAWRILVAFIIKQMRLGFDEEKANRRKFTAAVTDTSTATVKKQSAWQIKNQEKYAQAQRTMSQQQLLCPIPTITAGCPFEAYNDFDSHRIQRVLSQSMRKQCVLSDDEASQFYTPPSTRKQSRNCHFHECDADDSSESTEVWSSPRRTISPIGKGIAMS